MRRRNFGRSQCFAFGLECGLEKVPVCDTEAFAGFMKGVMVVGTLTLRKILLDRNSAKKFRIAQVGG